MRPGRTPVVPRPKFLKRTFIVKENGKVLYCSKAHRGYYVLNGGYHINSHRKLPNFFSDKKAGIFVRGHAFNRNVPFAIALDINAALDWFGLHRHDQPKPFLTKEMYEGMGFGPQAPGASPGMMGTTGRLR